MALLIALFFLQGPGEGWIMVQTPPREVKRVYWDLFETTEVWVLLSPEGPKGDPPRVNVIFQAFFSGRAKRDPYTGLPEWPRGGPERIHLRVQPFPLTVVDELSLRLVVDDQTLDLGASCDGRHAGPRCQILFPCADCFANGMSVEVEPDLLQRLAAARVVSATVLGFSVLLSADDLGAVGEFAEAIHWSTDAREALRNRK